MLRRTYYLYYTNVTYRTCPDCLSRHGKIFRDREKFSDCAQGCERSILSFRWKERSYYREQRRKMRKIAQAELVRRGLFAEGLDLLGEENDRAIRLLEQSAQIDLFLPEMKKLIAEKEVFLKENPVFRVHLRGLFIRAYSDKFGRPPYERIAEPMRIAREEAGLEEINELFA